MNDSTTNSMPHKLLISAEEAMYLLDIKDRRVLTRLIRDGKIKAVKLGNRYKINLASLTAFANNE